MKKANKVEFVALVEEVMATAIPADGKHTAAWCLAKLPPGVKASGSIKKWGPPGGCHSPGGAWS